MPMMVMACENGHMEMVRHLVKLGVIDLEGPDGLNALTLAIGQLDSQMVNILAISEVQPKTPIFLWDIIDELKEHIDGEKSDFKRRKMESLLLMLLENKIQDRFSTTMPCDRPHPPLAEEM